MPARAARPFVKWAGGKRQLLPQLVAASPAEIETYYEPFAGGAALLFALLARLGPGAPRRAVLNDLNAELVTTYRVVRDRLDALAGRLAVIEAEYLAAEGEDRAQLYYRVRAERPRGAFAVAARLIFLNRTCFNGLYRVNRSGRFNVPHGRYQNPRILDQAGLRAASAALQHVELCSVDFEEACDGAGPGDFVYFDPPFHPLSETSSFTAYTEQDFGWDDQLRLKGLIDRLARRGVAVMLSDSAHPRLERLYRDGGYTLAGYALEAVDARRAINSKADRRGPVDELLLTNYPLPERIEPAVQEPLAIA